MSIAAEPDQCPRCTSGYKSYSGGGEDDLCEVSFACGTRWYGSSTTGEVEFIDAFCEEGAEPICSNCDGAKCMHIVLRDWDGIDRCDGHCCPMCKPDAEKD